MPFSTFPIPSPQPSHAEVIQRVRQQSEELMKVIVALNSSLWDRVAAQEALIETVTAPLQTSISRRNGNALKKLKTVVQPLYQSMMERNAQSDAQIQMVHSAIGNDPTVQAALVPPITPITYTAAVGPIIDKGLINPYTATSLSPISSPSLSPSPSPVLQPSPSGKPTSSMWTSSTTGCITYTHDPAPSPGAEWVYQNSYPDDMIQPASPYWPAVSQVCDQQSTPFSPSVPPPVGIETPTPIAPPVQTPPTNSPPIAIETPPAETPPGQLVPTIPDEPIQPVAADAPCGQWFDWIEPIAPPGSPEWCRWADQTLKGFASIFDAVSAFEQSLLNTDAITGVFSGYVPMGSPIFLAGYAIDAVVGMLRMVISNGTDAVKMIRDAIRCMQALQEKMFARCDPRALAVLMLIRALIESIKKIRLGTDALVWATADVVLPLKPLEVTIDYLIQYVCPVEAPSPPEAIEAWLRGYIDDDLLHCIQRMHGQDADSFKPYTMARGEKIDSREAINWVRRQGGSGDDEKALLRKLGWVDDEQTAKFQELYWEIPTIGDHLEWLRKNVFDDAYVKDFDLMNGFEERFWPKFGKDLTTLGMRKDNAALHYAAHWLNPSFTQLFEMTQRLRPGRVDDSLVFTKDDLLRVMQEQDVGPYFRKRLERISHPIMNLTLQMKLYGLRTLSDDDFLAGLQDLGYTLEDATTLRDGLKYDVARLRASSGRGWTPSILSRLFALGLVTDDFVSTKMGVLGYSDEETQALLDRAPLELQARTVQRAKTRSLSGIINTSIAAFRCGATGRDQFTASLAAIGIDADTASTWADNIDASVQVDLCKQQVAAIRSAVFKGKITVADALQKLTDSGMPDLRAQQYVHSWALQLDSRSPTATASQLLRWVAEGLLDSDTAAQRLSNLGWQEADVAVSLAESKGKLAVRQARAEAAKARDERTQAKTLAQLVLDNQEETDRLKMSLKKVETPSRLQKWYYLGVIDVGYFRDRMADIGFGWELIDKYQAEIDAKLAADQRKAAQKGRKGQANQPGIGAQPGNGQQPPG